MGDQKSHRLRLLGLSSTECNDQGSVLGPLLSAVCPQLISWFKTPSSRGGAGCTSYHSRPISIINEDLLGVGDSTEKWAKDIHGKTYIRP